MTIASKLVGWGRPPSSFLEASFFRLFPLPQPRLRLAAGLTAAFLVAGVPSHLLAQCRTGLTVSITAGPRYGFGGDHVRIDTERGTVGRGYFLAAQYGAPGSFAASYMALAEPQELIGECAGRYVADRSGSPR